MLNTRLVVSTLVAANCTRQGGEGYAMWRDQMRMTWDKSSKWEADEPLHTTT